MIPKQTLIQYPVFGDNAAKIQPDAAKYSAGFVEADVLPAEWTNWFWNKSSQGVTDLNRGISSIEEELGNVVTGGGGTPAENNNTQVIDAIKYLIAQAKAEAILASHPIGSLFWTNSTEHPSVTFGGGTWERIKDRFVIAAGDTYGLGATGGAATVTLTVNNLPSHSHSFTPAGTVGSHSHGLNSHTHTFTPAGTVSSHVHGMVHEHMTTYTPAGTVTSHSHSVGAHYHGLNNHKHSGTTAEGGVDHYHNMDHYHQRGTMDITGWWQRSDVTGEGWYAKNIEKIVNGCFFYDANTFIKDSNAQRKTAGNSAWEYTSYRYLKFMASKSWEGGTSLQSSTQGTYTAKTNTGNSNKYKHTHTFTTEAASGNTANSEAFDTGKTKPDFVGTKATIRTGPCIDVDTTTPRSTTNTATPTFAGTAGTTGAASGNTANATPTFTGTAGTTGATGSATAIDKMPPYLGQYCWRRTA